MEIWGVMSISLSLVSVLKKIKDPSSNQPISESDKEEKGSTTCVHHFEYLVERPKNTSFPEEHLLCSTVAGAHIHLVKGVVRRNSPITVLCPTLAKGIICSRGTGPGMRGIPYRPKLLVKNHSNPNLQLWMCQGCKDKFLLRVNVVEFSLT